MEKIKDLNILKLFQYRGKVIQYKDTNLLARTARHVFVPVSVLLLFLMNRSDIVKFFKSFKYLQLLHLDISKVYTDWNVPRVIVSVVITALVCILILAVYLQLDYTSYRKLCNRKALAKMIVDKHYYDEESETVETIFGGRKTVKKIKYFPKIYYKVKNGKMEIQIELLMNQYQDQFIKLEKTFESGLYSEVIDKEQLDGYIKYTLIFDMLSSRIPIAEMKVKNGELKIMDGLYWAFDKLPHMLICGGTGSGKTWFLMMIIHALVATDSVLYILDPKNADLADFEGKLPNVYHKKADIIMIIENFYMEMMERSRVMKQMSSYKTGENYAYLGLPANFLMFDEYVAFMEMCDMKETQAVLNHLKQIVMLGRQAGFFIILGCQRPDAKYMGDGIRDQFNMRVALGRNSSLGYTMMFGEANKEFFQKSIKGRGYVDQGTGVITEMYTPTVPKGFDFFTEIINVYESNHGRHIEIPDDDEDEDDEIDLDEVI